MTLLRIITILAVVALASMPVAASAATLSTTIAVGSIDASALRSTDPSPALSGLAFGVQTLQLSIREAGSNEVLYTSDDIAVNNDRWETSVEEKLSDGVYTVELRAIGGFAFVVKPTGALTINSRTDNTTLSIARINLLSGGSAAAGATVPVSYLQVENTSNSPATLQGFWVRQNGSASTKAIIGLMTLDDRGALTGFSLGGANGALFSDNLGFAPAAATLAPGERRLFTIRALLAPDTSLYRGSQLMLDVASADTTGSAQGAFPIRGTIWTIQ
jgi:hypothetical protein